MKTSDVHTVLHLYAMLYAELEQYYNKHVTTT
jgi:hypothetical protein